MQKVGRGDIVLVAGGVDATKPRPAVVIQDDLFSGTDSIQMLELERRLIVFLGLAH